MVLPEGFCDVEINFTVAIRAPGRRRRPYHHQVKFDNVTATVTSDNSPLTLDVLVPQCNWILDLYTCPVIDVPAYYVTPNGNVRSTGAKTSNNGP